MKKAVVAEANVKIEEVRAHQRDTDYGDLKELATKLKQFVARGIIALVDYGGGNHNRNIAGRYCYVSQKAHDVYQWDGAHRATHFESAAIALDSAEQCNGPWFNAPADGTVEAIEVEANWRTEHVNTPYSTAQDRPQPDQRKKKAT